MSLDAFEDLRMLAVREWPPIEPPRELLRRQVRLAMRRRRRGALASDPREA
jgi:hypothetical protein